MKLVPESMIAISVYKPIFISTSEIIGIIDVTLTDQYGLNETSHVKLSLSSARFGSTPSPPIMKKSLFVYPNSIASASPDSENAN